MIRQKSFENNAPTVYLVPTPIGNLSEMSPRAIEVLKSVDIIAAEDTRNTIKLLNAYEIKTHCIAHHSYNEDHSADGIVELLKSGKNVAIVTDAGYPLISDPGQVLVTKAVENGFNVVPLSGCNAGLDALVASGINAQPYLFVGFLPSKKNDCIKKLKELSTFPYTMIFYEAPHRIMEMLERCYEVLGDRRVCLARELTKKHEEFIRGTLSELLEIEEELKGEMVIVIEGYIPDEDEPLDMDQISVIIDQYIEEGLSTKEAIKKVASERGLSKNEVYNLYHQK